GSMRQHLRLRRRPLWKGVRSERNKRRSRSRVEGDRRAQRLEPRTRRSEGLAVGWQTTRPGPGRGRFRGGGGGVQGANYCTHFSRRNGQDFGGGTLSSSPKSWPRESLKWEQECLP